MTRWKRERSKNYFVSDTRRRPKIMYHDSSDEKSM